MQRLSARQQSHGSGEGSFFEAERERKLWKLRDGESSSGFLTPTESIVSTGTNHSGGSELTTGSGFSLGSLTYLPDKLQIVKPLEGEGLGGASWCPHAALEVPLGLAEPLCFVCVSPPPGSVTLHHWQQLARPNLGGILVPRPGVLTKDFRQLDIDLEEVYSLTDLEEDEVEAASFQLLPTSTPTKAKERPGGERRARGWGAMETPAPPCPPAAVPPRTPQPLSLSPRRPSLLPLPPRGDALAAVARGHAGRGGLGKNLAPSPR